MSPHLPDGMENPSSSPQSNIAPENRSTSKMSVPFSSTSSAGCAGNILLDEERSSNSPSLPSLAGLPMRIRSASLPALTELCIMCFDDEGAVLEAATNYPNIFFLMHKWFTTSEALAQDLRRLFDAGKPFYHLDYLSLLTSIQQSASPSSSSADSSSRPPSVIMSRKQDDCNGNVGLRSPSLLRTPNGRSNSVLIPRPACIGVEDDNYFSYHYSKLNALLMDSCSVETGSKGDKSSTSSEKTDDSSSKASELQPPCPKGEQCQHDRSSLCPVYKFRRSICYAVRFWIRQFPVHFDLDPKLSTLVKDWQRSLAHGTPENQHCGYAEFASLIDLSCLPSYDWIRNISVRDPTVKHCRKVSLVFNHLEPCDLAKHLTYLEHRIMRRISFQDYKQYAVTGSLSDNPRLERSVNLFNGLTQWVQCMVLSRSTPQQRAEVIVKLIEVTKQLKELRNFNSLMAVVGGLSHSSLARLTRTASRVPGDSQRSLAELTEFLSSSANFSNYRRALHECKGFKIPILGVHMKDLISLHVALSDAVEGGLINFRKMAQLSMIFQELQELQNATPPAGANIDLVNTLRVSLELAYTEDEIYELSLAREPRDSISPQSSPTRPSLLGEWPAAGQSNYSQTLTPNSAANLLSSVRDDVKMNGMSHTTLCEGSRSGSRSASLSSPQTSLLPLPPASALVDVPHSMRLNSVGSDQEPEGSSASSVVSTADSRLSSKKTMEERMNDMVDAVFGNPKHDLLKLIQRSSPNDQDPPVTPLSVEPGANDQAFEAADASHQFKHDFQETNSFRPCTCAHCNGLLWGPLRQAYKCRECGISAHKMCKDVLNLRCQPKNLVPSPFPDGFQGVGSAGRGRFRRRKKLSGHSDVDSLESGLMAIDCNCELGCPSPCSRRSSIAVVPHRELSEFHSQDQFSTERGLLASDGDYSSESCTPLLCSRSSLLFRSPKRRSLIGAMNSGTTTSAATLATSAAISSPLPIIRHRKSSLSFTTPCRSFPGNESSIEASPVHRSSLSPSPRRKISDTLHLLGSSSHKSTTCPCSHRGHHQ